MEIKTKFNLGDKVWTLKNFKATEVEISAIEIEETGVEYRCKDPLGFYPETQCFATKEELITYICDDGNESM